MGRTELVVVLMFALASCSKEREVIETPINFVIDDDDKDAKDLLARIELEVWPATANACPTMSSWRTEMCGEPDCSAAPSPRDRDELPDATAELSRDAFGQWSPLRLPAPTQGPWELVVRGLDAGGNVFLYGCKAVSAADSWDIHMWRPWCDVEGLCRGLFHKACQIEIECVSTAPRGETEVTASPVVCRAQRTFEDWWEEGGVECPPTSLYYGPCYAARIACEPGRLTPARDGVCPRRVELPCGSDPSLDLDCNHELPGPCGACDPMIEPQQRCAREDELCRGVTQCQNDGTWGPCVYSPGEFEECDGVDTDCDNLPEQGDDFDPDALNACNRDRPRNQPIADSCTGGTCLCGSGAPCGRNAACRSGRCVPIPEIEPKLDDGGTIMPAPDGAFMMNPDNGNDAAVYPDAETFPDVEVYPDATTPDAGMGRRDAMIRDNGN